MHGSVNRFRNLAVSNLTIKQCTIQPPTQQKEQTMKIRDIFLPNLKHLVGGADRIAVIDCETTGLYKNDRIIELAIITMDLNGRILETWETLVQPLRDVGATHIHGITTKAVKHAPTFADIAGDVALRLNGACVAAHNLPFDRQMLVNEFARLDIKCEIDNGIDTLQATGVRLDMACETHRVRLKNAHSAAADAIAVAKLIRRVAKMCEAGEPALIPTELPPSNKVLRRGDKLGARVASLNAVIKKYQALS